MTHDCPNPWACHNHEPHTAPRGCVHHAAWLADHHDRDEANDE